MSPFIVKKSETPDNKYGGISKKELKKRTRCIRVFPNKESLLRIATALLIELDEKWLANGKVYLKGRRQGFGKCTEKNVT